ncbi:MAG: hypothetical protein KC506_00985, partial [Nanoarchaeota archaeon]|nr:hypothetical protein [Nanoarchaeota archaeon]
MKKEFIVLGLLLILSTSVVSASWFSDLFGGSDDTQLSPSKQVTVRVKDSDTGGAIYGAVVIFSKVGGSGSSPIKTTGTDGLTPFVSVDVGERYNFDISASGYQSRIVGKEIEAGGSSSFVLDVKLTPGSGSSDSGYDGSDDDSDDDNSGSSSNSNSGSTNVATGETRNTRVKVIDRDSGQGVSGAVVIFRGGSGSSPTKFTDTNGFTGYIGADVGKKYNFDVSAPGYVEVYNYGNYQIQSGSSSLTYTVILVPEGSTATVPSPSANSGSNSGSGSCEETDDGYDIYNKGKTTTVDGVNKYDSCDSYGNLKEFSCNSVGGYDADISPCPTGYYCGNGACIGSNSAGNTETGSDDDSGCFDSDFGKVPHKTGYTLIGNDDVEVDTCNPTGVSVIEYYCQDGESKHIVMPCGSGKV